MTNYKKISVFFAFQFYTAVISKTDREVALIQAIRQAQLEIEQEHPDFLIEWKDCQLETGRQIGEQIADLISACDILIADISEFNRNVIFELGIAYALQRTQNKKVVWLIHESVDTADVPADIGGLFLAKYDGQNLRPILAQQIRDSALDIIVRRKESTDVSEYVRRLRHFWAFRGNVIDIVCSNFPKDEKLEYTRPHHRNYLRLGTFADLDSLVHVMVNVTKMSPQALVRPYSSAEYNELGGNENLIVIGGPSWNSKFRELQSALPFKFIENIKGIDDLLFIDGYIDCPFRPSYTSDKPYKDISLFTRYHNSRGVPYFLLAGCLTYGVLGAARSFLNGNGLDNANYIENLVHGQDFVLVFETEIDVATSNASFSHVQNPLLLMKRQGQTSKFEVIVENVEPYRSKS